MLMHRLFHRGETGIRTLEGLPPTRFPGVRLKPLGHLSVPTATRKGCKSTEFLSPIPKFPKPV